MKTIHGNSLEPFKTGEIEREFMWLDRFGGLHDPAEMETRHLFYTIRMIWNHTAPEDMKIKPYNKYSFGPFYNEDYIRKAVRYMLAELFQRRDLDHYMNDQLEEMSRFLAKLDSETQPRRISND